MHLTAQTLVNYLEFNMATKKPSNAPKRAEAPKPKNDHIKEEVLVNVGDTNASGFTVKAILKDGRLLVDSRSCTKVIDKSEF